MVLDLDKSVTIVKKLKLIGYPYKIFKNTSFVKVRKQMFVHPLMEEQFCVRPVDLSSNSKEKPALKDEN